MPTIVAQCKLQATFTCNHQKPFLQGHFQRPRAHFHSRCMSATALGTDTVPASSHQFSRRSRQILGGPPMQAICCRLFQSASSSSASIFCTYSMADSSPASSLTMPCQERKQNLQHPVTSPTDPQVSHSQARKKSLRAVLAALLLVLAMQELPNSDPGEEGSASRGIWRASCPTYPAHLVQCCQHLLQLLHLLPGH